MDELVTRLLPALRQLHADGAVDDALRHIETIPDLLAGTAGIVGTATVLLDVGRSFEGGAVEAPLAERVHVNEGILARSLLSCAIDDTDPDPTNVVALLDGIDSAYERAQLGLRQAASGETIPLDTL